MKGIIIQNSYSATKSEDTAALEMKKEREKRRQEGRGKVKPAE